MTGVVSTLWPATWSRFLNLCRLTVVVRSGLHKTAVNSNVWPGSATIISAWGQDTLSNSYV